MSDESRAVFVIGEEFTALPTEELTQLRAERDRLAKALELALKWVPTAGSNSGRATCPRKEIDEILEGK